MKKRKELTKGCALSQKKKGRTAVETSIARREGETLSPLSYKKRKNGKKDPRNSKGKKKELFR